MTLSSTIGPVYQMSTPLISVLLSVLFGQVLQPDAGILLVQPERHPHVRIAWVDARKIEHAYEADLSYGWDGDREPIGGNIAAYVAVGGTRLLKGAGHPRGAIVRVGFYKIQQGLLFFDGIGADSVIEVELSGVFMNQPAAARPETIVQHLKFSRDALKSCRIASDAWNLFNTVDPDETLNGRIRPGYDARPGALDGRGSDHGSAEAVVADDGSITLRARVPYALFKHIRDPWQHAIPGTFLEPIHFHIEMEILPQGVNPGRDDNGLPDD